MELDYNEYYCSANLPPLLRARGVGTDHARADAIETFVIAACERAISLDTADEWVWPTLLGAAFRSGDIDKADELASRIETVGLSKWILETTLLDLRDIVAHTSDETVRTELLDVLERLNDVLKEGC